MDEEKKRKKNKKKKNKNKAKEDAVVVSEETVSSDQELASEQNAAGQGSGTADDLLNISEKADVKNGEVLESEVQQGRSGTDHLTAPAVSETQKQQWLQREAKFEETIRNMQAEKEILLKKGARLEMRVVELEYEKESVLQNQARLEGKITQLVDENSSAKSKQASLEERIVQLLEDQTIMSSKYAENDEKIKYLLREKDLWSSKEAKFEETVEQLEKEKESLILKQKSIEHLVASLNGDNKLLQDQVQELEGSKSRIEHENQMLLENMSALQVQLQNQEKTQISTDDGKENSEIDVLNSQIDAASNLIAKLVTENADLVEKVNELFIELERERTSAEISSAYTFEPDAISVALGNNEIVADNMQDSNTAPSENDLEASKVIPFRMESNGFHEVDIKQSAVVDAPKATTNSGEIVQLPLSANESLDTKGQLTVNEDEDLPVQFADAPLTGAPIRFISFMARYVSGADLVSKNPTSSSK